MSSFPPRKSQTHFLGISWFFQCNTLFTWELVNLEIVSCELYPEVMDQISLPIIKIMQSRNYLGWHAIFNRING